MLKKGGGGGFIHSCSARQISFQIDQFEVYLKNNSSDRKYRLYTTPISVEVNLRIVDD